MTLRVVSRSRAWTAAAARAVATAGLAAALLIGGPVARELAVGFAGIAGSGSGAAGGSIGDAPVALAISTTTTSAVAHNEKHGTITTSEAGRPVHITVRVSSTEGTPTGSVKVYWYAGTATCKGTEVASNTAALSSGSADVTALVATPMTPQTISFLAQYLGSGAYAPSNACIAVTITKATPSMTTAAHDAGHNAVTSVLVTQSAHGRATVNGAAGVPTGSVTFELRTGSDCTGSLLMSGVKTLGATAVAESDPSTYTAPFATSYKIYYNGDAVYSSRVGTCRPIEWKKANPTFSLEIHRGTNHTATFVTLLHSSLHPDATIGGPLGTPSGGTWRVYSYSAEDCGGNQIGFAPLPLTTGAVDDPAIILSSLSVPGIASYQTRYTGDDRYLAGASQCVDVGMKGLVEVSLDVHDEGHDVVSVASVGDEIHGTSTVSGEFDPPTGTVEIRLFFGTGCTELTTTVDLAIGPDGTVDGGAMPFSLVSVGSVSMMAHYQGNGDYFSNESACRGISVVQATPTPAPSATQPPPTPTPAPGATTAPGASADPGASPDLESLGPGESTGPGATDGPVGSGTGVPSGAPASAAGSAGASADPGGPVDGGAASPIGGLALALGALLAAIVVVAALGFVMGRRRRSQA